MACLCRSEDKLQPDYAVLVKTLQASASRRQVAKENQGYLSALCRVNFASLRLRLSVDEFTAKITNAGGSMVTPKMVIPGIGWFAYGKDTEGNLFGIKQND